ncbi:MAG: hypothetical protein ACRBB0_18540 [Pelagimonas sp.]|uniref:hypothetical protein n=1 Tax=Pelagimonas sp. TaxID=2073170 RepID=UPI003D6A33B3
MALSRLTLGITCALGLVGCVEDHGTAVPLKLSPEVQLTAKGRSMPIARIAAVRFNVGKHEQRQNRLLPFQYITCHFEAATFSMDIEESGVFNLPLYGKNTPPITITCNRFGTDVTHVFKPRKVSGGQGGADWIYPMINFALIGPPMHRS